jgi:hypothetical protein
MNGCKDQNECRELALTSDPSMQVCCSIGNEQAFNRLLDACVLTVVQGQPIWYRIGQAVTMLLKHGNDSVTDVVKEVYSSSAFQDRIQNSPSQAITLTALTLRVHRARNSFLVASALKDHVIITEYTSQNGFLILHSLAKQYYLSYEDMYKQAGGKNGLLPKNSSLESLKHALQLRLAGPFLMFMKS